MKAFNPFFCIFFASIFVLSFSSCSKNDTEDLGPYYKIQTAKSLNETYGFLLGEEARIVDFRSAADFQAGHIRNAVNIPATLSNTASNESEFCRAVLRQFSDKTKPILFYGKKTAIDLEHIVPGRVSKIGYGYNNTFILKGGYDEWIREYPDDIEVGR